MPKKKKTRLKYCYICGTDHYSRGLCRTHYSNWYLCGDPLRTQPTASLVPGKEIIRIEYNKAGRSHTEPKKLKWGDLRGLGFFTPYDIALWCKSHGLIPLYVTNRRRLRHMDSWNGVDSTKNAYWDVYNLNESPLPIHTVAKDPEVRSYNAAAIAMAWAESKYGVPMIHLPAGPAISLAAHDVLCSMVEHTVMEESDEVKILTQPKASSGVMYEPSKQKEPV